MQGDGCGMNQTTDHGPAAVPVTAKQVGEVRLRWGWAEPSVWTDRMLTALENGVKGGVWFSLIDKVYSPANLLASYAKVAANGGAPGVDHVTVEEFGKRLAGNLDELVAQTEGRHFPSPGSATGEHPQAGQQGNTAAGNSHGPRSRRARRRCAGRWSRSSSSNSPSTATAFAPVVGAKTRCDVWTGCSTKATGTLSMSI